MFIGDVGQRVQAKRSTSRRPRAPGGRTTAGRSWRARCCTGASTAAARAPPPACNAPSLHAAHHRATDHSSGRLLDHRRLPLPRHPRCRRSPAATSTADNCTGAIIRAAHERRRLDVGSTPCSWTRPSSISAFGEDEAGELYVRLGGNGSVQRLREAAQRAAACRSSAPPSRRGTQAAPPCIFRVSLAASSAPARDRAVRDRGRNGRGRRGLRLHVGHDHVPAGQHRADVPVDVLADLLDEAHETFMLAPRTRGAACRRRPAHGHDPRRRHGPGLVVAGCAVIEGNAGTTAWSGLPDEGAFRLIRSTVTVDYATADGTATAGADYAAMRGSSRSRRACAARTVSVAVSGDLAPEPNESFTLAYAPVNATGDASAARRRSWTTTPRHELTHGMTVTRDLRRPRRRRLPDRAGAPRVVRGRGRRGVGRRRARLLLERLAADGSTVLQTAPPVGTGTARSLRWQNTARAPPSRASPSASTRPPAGPPAAPTTSTACARTRRRLIPRFNNSASQVTVVVLQNPTDAPVAATPGLLERAGALLRATPLTLPRTATLVAERPRASRRSPGQSGTSRSPTTAPTARSPARRSRWSPRPASASTRRCARGRGSVRVRR